MICCTSGDGFTFVAGLARAGDDDFVGRGDGDVVSDFDLVGILAWAFGVGGGFASAPSLSPGSSSALTVGDVGAGDRKERVVYNWNKAF